MLKSELSQLLQGVTPWNASFLIMGVKYATCLKFQDPKCPFWIKERNISSEPLTVSYCTFFIRSLYRILLTLLTHLIVLYHHYWPTSSHCTGFIDPLYHIALAFLTLTLLIHLITLHWLYWFTLSYCAYITYMLHAYFGIFLSIASLLK